MRRNYSGKVGDFTIFLCEMSSGFCVPKIIKVDSFFRRVISPFLQPSIVAVTLPRHACVGSSEDARAVIPSWTVLRRRCVNAVHCLASISAICSMRCRDKSPKSYGGAMLHTPRCGSRNIPTKGPRGPVLAKIGQRSRSQGHIIYTAKICLKAQIPLGSTRLDTFDFVEPVEPVERVETSVSSETSRAVPIWRTTNEL